MTKSSLLTKDDYWSIWLGAFLLLLGLVAFLSNRSGDLSRQMTEQDLIMQEESRKAPFETIAWHEALEKKNTVKASSLPIGLFLKKLTTKPSTWNSNPLVAFVTTKQQADRAKDESKEAYISLVAQVTAARNQALASQNLAAQDSYQNDQYNNAAVAAIGQWQESKQALEKVQKKQSTKAANKIPWLITLMLVLGLLFGIGMTFMETSFFTFLKGFAFVSLIGLIAYTLAAQADMKAIGFGYAAWAIIIGLLISNTIGTPQWVQPALSTEFYIKTGLVILGAEILLGKILAIGLPGIFVAWVVTPIVLITTYWFGQKVLKIGSKTLNMTISADMSVCGVSAAVATAAACKATKEELTVAIGLSMIFTSVMMIVLPAFINWVGIPEILGGAWIGGTIDATGAVVAAGAFLGEKALSVAATIKMIQNVLIGLIAFGVAIYFSTRVDRSMDTKVGWGEIWKRFPKFVLGFIGASLLFSITYSILDPNTAHAFIDQGVINAFTKNIRGWLFCLAFVSIGLSINFKDLKKHFIGGKPLLLYLCGQTFNLSLTLLMAYIMFYLVFPDITNNI